MKKRSFTLFLTLALLLSSIALGEKESFTLSSEEYRVPNPVNLWQTLGNQARFELIEHGEMTAGNLRGSAYAIRYTGNDDELADKAENSPYELIHLQYVDLEKELGIQIENRTVSVNDTEAALYTYPNGGRVLYAAFLPDMEPLMLIECDCGLILDEAVGRDDDFSLVPSTTAPAATPTPKPKAYPPAFGKSGSIDFMGDTLVTYEYHATSTELDRYITALKIAGYQMTESKADLPRITMTFRNDEEDIELEIVEIMPGHIRFSNNSTILITYYNVCPDGDIVNGQIVRKSSSSSSSGSTGTSVTKATSSPTAKPTSRASVVAAPSTSSRCSYCNGRKICPVCNGKRRYYVSGYGVGQGSYVNCAGCNGTGRCSYCK